MLKIRYLLITFFLSTLTVNSQQIQFNKKSIFINEDLVIIVTNSGKKISNISPSPQIHGFKKLDSVITEHEYQFKYRAIEPGKFDIPTFEITVNNRVITSKKALIVVSNHSFFKNFFKNEASENTDDETFEYVAENIQGFEKEEAFLYLDLPKKSVYIGEALPSCLSVYILESKSSHYEFENFAQEYDNLIKSFKPKNCLEENIPVGDIKAERVLLKKKKYLKFKLYESVFFPLSTEPVLFPKSSINLGKKKRLGNGTHLVNLAYFQTKIITKPLSNESEVSNTNVGNYGLKEFIKSSKIKMGSIVNYSFIIYGEGNLSGISKPSINFQNPYFEIIEGETKTFINKSKGTIDGSVKFNFQLIPKKNGVISLENLMYWGYFDTRNHRHDTLRPKITVKITGDDDDDKSIAANQSDAFYELIKSQNSNLRPTNSKDEFKKWANIGFIVMLSFTLLFIFRRRNIKKK